MDSTHKNTFREGFVYYVLATLLMALQFGLYMVGNSMEQLMDFPGWCFFVCSCLSHAAIITLVPFVLFAVPASRGWNRTAWGLFVGLVSLLSVLNLLNGQVFNLYRFHINGMVLDMVFGNSAGEVFTFDTGLYVREILAFAALVAVCTGFRFLSRWVCLHARRLFVLPVVLFFAGCTLFAHIYHIYGAFFHKTAVVESARLIPYYFPTTAYRFMLKHGFVAQDDYINRKAVRRGSGLNYPIHPLQRGKVCRDSMPNIVFLVLDSWNKRTLTPQCMPNAYRFATENQWYDNHFSSSNGTRSGIFGMFFGLSCYYWESCDAARTQPLMMRELLSDGYDVKVFPSASLMNPPIARVMFGDVPHLRTSTAGNTVYGRDSCIAGDFIKFVKGRGRTRRPFFSFVFFDLPHSFQLTARQNTRFKPAWAYANYLKLDNGTDPTPFFNLYRNCCYEDDQFLGNILNTLNKSGLMGNTIVFITGDHSQEFNENHKNFWGHNGNFSKWQVSVPLICHFPKEKTPHKYSYRTSHYDFVPTIMKGFLGIRNPESDYCMGHQLGDRRPRGWMVVGSSLNYAFIADGDTILEKKADGALEVFDPHMNLIPAYRLNPKKFNNTVKNLNRFYKQ